MKKITFFALLLLISLTLAGCVNKTDIVFWHTMGKENVNVIENLFAEWKTKNNVKLSVEFVQKGGYDELYKSISTTISAGTYPNVAFCYNDHVASYNEDNPVVVDLTQFIEKDNEFKETIKDFIPTYYQEGKQYSQVGDLKGFFNLPFAKSTEALFYNKDIFESYGYKTEDLKTWEGFFDVCRKIKKDHSFANFVAGYDSEANLFIGTCEQFGLPYTSFTSNGVGSIDFAKEGEQQDRLINKLAEYKKAYEDKLICTKETSGIKGYTSDLLKKGDTIFSIGSTGGMRYNVSYDSSEKLKFTTGVLPLPQSKLAIVKEDYKKLTEEKKDLEGKLTAGNLEQAIVDAINSRLTAINSELAVIEPVYNANKEEIEKYGYKRALIQQGPNICMLDKGEEANAKAWTFMKFMTSPEVMAVYAAESGYAPARFSAYQVPVLKQLIEDGLKINPTDKKSMEKKLVAEVMKIYETSANYYYSSPAFDKSAKARQNVGLAMQNIINPNDENKGKTIKQILLKAYLDIES